MATNKLTQINQKNISNGTSNKEAAANTDKKSSGFNKKKLAFSAAAAAAIAAIAIGSILMARRGKTKIPVETVVPKVETIVPKEIIPTPQEPPVDLEKLQSQMRELLEKRRLYEERVMAPVGGKTGLDMTWGEIIHWAKEGEYGKSLNFALNYPKKAELVEKDYEKLNQVLDEAGKLIGQNQKILEQNPNDDARLLQLPFDYKDTVERVIKNGNLLKTSGAILEDASGNWKHDLKKFHEVLDNFIKNQPQL